MKDRDVAHALLDQKLDNQQFGGPNVQVPGQQGTSFAPQFLMPILPNSIVFAADPIRAEQARDLDIQYREVGTHEQRFKHSANLIGDPLHDPPLRWIGMYIVYKTVYKSVYNIVYN